VKGAPTIKLADTVARFRKAFKRRQQQSQSRYSLDPKCRNQAFALI